MKMSLKKRHILRVLWYNGVVPENQIYFKTIRRRRETSSVTLQQPAGSSAGKVLMLDRWDGWHSCARRVDGLFICPERRTLWTGPQDTDWRGM